MALPSFHLILDFDGTIVQDSTLPLFDYLRQKDGSVSYGLFLEPYMRDYTQHVKDYKPAQRERITLQQEYDFLESLLKVEKTSVERIESSGWLEGLKWSWADVSAFDIAASHIERKEKLSWRPGFASLVKKTWETKGIVDIVSVNWSSNFIRALLRQEFGQTIDIDKIGVYSNEIDPDGSGRFSRVRWESNDKPTNEWPVEEIPDHQANRGIWVAKDKARVTQTIVKNAKIKDLVAVYVGDSKTDLQCIMEADIGICIRDDTNLSAEQISLREVLDRLKIRQLPVEKLDFRFFDRLRYKESQDKNVYYAQDLDIIRGALLDLA